MFQSPGVYVEDVSASPPSVVEVSTAIPSFLVYTQKQPYTSSGVAIHRVESMLHFEKVFGGPHITEATVTIEWETLRDSTGADKSNEKVMRDLSVEQTENPFLLYYALKHYFTNGGGPCYVVSVGVFPAGKHAKGDPEQLKKGLTELEKEDEPTLIVLTDAATTLDDEPYYNLVGTALEQCEKLQDRFTIVDVVPGKNDE